jgi:TatD DNase family protein
LPPVPYRGKTNLPIYIWKTAEKIAEIFGLSVKETVEITRNNTLELFKIVNK